MRAAVGGFVELDRPGPSRRIHRSGHRVEHLRIARGNREVCFEHIGQPLRQLRPCRAAIRRFVNATRAWISRVGTKRVRFPKGLLLLPQRRVDRAGIARINAHVIAARVFVFVQHAVECASAVRRPINAALGVRPVRVAECGDEEPIGIGGIDIDHRDHQRGVQARVHPGAARIRRFVDAVAGGEVGTDDTGARTDVDDAGIGRRHRNRADRARGLLIEQRLPVGAVISRAPEAAVVEPDIEDGRMTGHPARGARAAGAAGSDGPPAQRGDVRRLRRSG